MNLRRETEKLEAKLDTLARRLADPSRHSPLPTPDEIQERVKLMEQVDALAVAAILLSTGNGEKP